ncbi:MAG: hypothetical protein KAS30_02835 [Candidatus Diapherotrites archaeon]|nr:hypothetical protein [Candidatus Diapherotrites archaeon]
MRRINIIKKKKALEAIREKTQEERRELRAVQNQLFETNLEFKQAKVKNEEMEHLQKLSEQTNEKPIENNDSKTSN